MTNVTESGRADGGLIPGADSGIAPTRTDKGRRGVGAKCDRLFGGLPAATLAGLLAASPVVAAQPSSPLTRSCRQVLEAIDLG